MVFPHYPNLSPGYPNFFPVLGHPPPVFPHFILTYSHINPALFPQNPDLFPDLGKAFRAQMVLFAFTYHPKQNSALFFLGQKCPLFACIFKHELSFSPGYIITYHIIQTYFWSKICCIHITW